jgi:hypothetical protein
MRTAGWTDGHDKHNSRLSQRTSVPSPVAGNNLGHNVKPHISLLVRSQWSTRFQSTGLYE